MANEDVGGNVSENHCTCFGDTGLQASTYSDRYGDRRCDLCGRLVTDIELVDRALARTAMRVSHTPQAIRATAITDFFELAAAIVDSDPVIRTYAACEWDELGEDGKLWIAAIVRETFARAPEPTDER